MIRFLLNLSTALSLLIGMTAGALWLHGRGGAGRDRDFVSFRAGRQRRTLRWNAGRVTWYSPPPVPSAPQPAAADDAPARLVGKLRNDQLVWEVEYPLRDFPDLHLGPHSTPRGRAGTPAGVLAPVDPGERMPPEMQLDRTVVPRPARPLPLSVIARPLLAALEDPERFAASHVVLMHLTGAHLRGPAAPGYAFTQSDDDPTAFVLERDGLRTELKAPPGPGRFYTYSPSYGDDFEVCACVASTDPVQRFALARQWHARLDVPVLSIHCGVAVLVACVLPACRGAQLIAKGLRRRRRLRLGRCGSCGYELTGNVSGVCPECASPAKAPA